MLKKITSLLFITLSYLQASSQGLVGIYNHTISISPSYTVNNNSAITVAGQVINTSTTTITGNIIVNVAIDTSSTIAHKYYWRTSMGYPVTNLLPGATFAFSINDNASNTNAYKVSGNGTTVVAWPVAGLPNDSLTCSDSAFANVYILPITQGSEPLTLLQNELTKLPNPITQNTHFTNAESYTIELIDLNGRIYTIQHSTLNIQHFVKGLYLLRFRNEQGNEVSKKIIIN